MKGFVLAAGLGTRLMPHTGVVPKPLFPVLGIPVMRWVLASLRQAGVDDVVVNLHHLPDSVVNYLSTHPFEGMAVHFSFEKEILGTGGAIVAADRWLFQDEFFLLHNGDIFNDWDLSRLANGHGPALAVVDGPLVAQGDRRVELAADGRVKALRGQPVAGNGRRVVYGGAARITRSVCERLRSGMDPLWQGLVREACLVADGLIPMLADGLEIGAVEYDDVWYRDIGTLDSYLGLNRKALQNVPELMSLRGFESPPEVEPNVYISHEAHIGSGVRFVGPVMICPGARIESGAVVGPFVTVGGTVGAGVRISDAVVMDGYRIGEDASGMIVP